MRAVEISAPGPPEVLRLASRPDPSPSDGDVLIRVAAAGVNRPDVLQRQGRYPPPPGASDIPGLEVAGTVVSSRDRRWTEGDTVCALVAGGGYAELCVAPGAQCLPIPRGLDVTAAAAVPETYFTVWTNLFQRGRLAAGERLLVHGGTSGIGTTAIQLARAFGADVYATAGNDEKCAACERLGARAINYNSTDFVAAVRDLTTGRGVDVVMDVVGGEYLQRNVDCLAMDGRLIQIGLLGGARSQLNLSAVMQKRIVITGSTLRPRSVAEKGAIGRDLEEKVWPLIGAGTVRPIVQQTFPLERAADAHRVMEEGRLIGKLVLTTA
jgi:putative PIG3 family NAD(P)H quinone oxidoreductase